MATGLSALRHDQSLAWNSLQQLEHDFLIYGKYNVENLQDIVMTVNSLWNRTLSTERLLTGQDLQNTTGSSYGTRCHWQDDIHS